MHQTETTAQIKAPEKLKWIPKGKKFTKEYEAILIIKVATPILKKKGGFIQSFSKGNTKDCKKPTPAANIRSPLTSGSFVGLKEIPGIK